MPQDTHFQIQIHQPSLLMLCGQNADIREIYKKLGCEVKEGNLAAQ
jgi:hypothetical protein